MDARRLEQQRIKRVRRPGHHAGPSAHSVREVDRASQIGGQNVLQPFNPLGPHLEDEDPVNDPGEEIDPKHHQHQHEQELQRTQHRPWNTALMKRRIPRSHYPSLPLSPQPASR